MQEKIESIDSKYTIQEIKSKEILERVRMNEEVKTQETINQENYFALRLGRRHHPLHIISHLSQIKMIAE